MVRNYKRKIGSRNYVNYSEDTLAQCLEDIRTKIKTQREASSYYKIPRSTIKLKLKGKYK